MKRQAMAMAAGVLACLAALAWGGASAADTSQSPTQLPVKGKVNLIDVGAGSCIPCKMMAPILDELKREYAGRAEVHFIDVRYDREAIEKYKLRGIPTQIFFDASGKEVARHLGFMDKEALVKALASLGVK